MGCFMKKKLLSIFLFTVTVFCFSNTTETSDVNENTDMNDIKNSITVSQQKILDTIKAETIDNSVLDVIQENNEIISEENKEIAKENEESKIINKLKKKATNKPVIYKALGVEFPFSFVNWDSSDLFENSFPFGITCQFPVVVKLWSFKGNIKFEFVPFEDGENIFSLSGFLSLGIAPVHNDFLFLGLYGTVGVEFLDDFIYTSAGGSGTIVFDFTKLIGLFVNVDATYRFGENNKSDTVVDIGLNSLKQSWRFSPSIGIAIRH